MNWSIQEYLQRNTTMVGNRGFQGIQYERGQTYSNTTRSIAAERRYKLSQPWNKEVFFSLYQVFLICEMVDPSISSSAQLVCAAAIKTKKDRENRKRGYEVQIEGSYQGGKFQMEREPAQSGDTIHVQASVEEAPDKKQEE